MILAEVHQHSESPYHIMPRTRTLPILPILSILLLALLLGGCGSLAPTHAAPPRPTAPVLPTIRPTFATVRPSTAPLPPVPATTTPPPTPTTPPTPEPLPSQAAAMRATFAGDLATLPNIPHYTLRLEFAPDQHLLNGVMRLIYTNTVGVSLETLALRLYPNFPQDLFGSGGDTRMEITAASVAGGPVPISYAAADTALIVPLDPPLGPDASVTVDLAFTATVQAWQDGSYPLTGYYPMLAVWGDDGWRLDVSRFPDHIFAETALYSVTVTAPTALTVAATGSTLATRLNPDDKRTWQIVTGPVRQFALSIGDYVSLSEQVGDVQVTAYTQRGNGLFLREYLRTAASALATFERLFGAYPYRELDLHLLPYTFNGGDEYPGLIFVYTSGTFGAGARYVTAHEVAHQWWFAIVGNDIFTEAWLDEAFAQYSGILAVAELAGPEAAATDYEREVLYRYQGALADGDLPIGWSITRYSDFNVYYRTVYGKGAVFLATLREQLGDEVFFAALQRYYNRHRYGVATGRDVQAAFEQASGRDLEPIFRTWVYGWE